MGNEASMPNDVTASHDGLQPPSQIPPGGTATESTANSTAASRTDKIKAIFKRNNADTFRDTEMARAAADGGHMAYTPTNTRAPLPTQHTQQYQYQTQRQQQQKDQGQYGAAGYPQQYYDPNMAPPQQQQQQQQQQSYYKPGNSPQGYAVDASTPLQGAEPPVVGVMYATEGHHRTIASSAAESIRSGGKAVRNSGRAILNTMKNLSLRTANTGAASKTAKEEREWETRWDEDDDSDEGDEDEIPAKPAAVPVVAPQQHQQTVSAPPPPPPQDAKMNGLLNHQQVMSYQHQQPPMPQASVAQDAITKKTEELQPKIEPTPSEDKDGVEWDTGAGTGPVVQNQVYEKPNVQMFLPLLRVLGKGSFGKVVLVQKRKGTERGALFAMKILRKVHLVKRRQIERTRTERKVLSVVDHPFIMKLHYAFQTEDKLYLVLDYCPGGELFFHLSRFRRFPERVARFYAAELLLAIGHLHKRGIIYRDLKPENVLLDADGHVKLGDFGLAKAGIRHPCEGATSMCGTPEYMAPEVLAQAGHGFCVDYWGLGMLVYEMMTGLPPWYTTDRAKLFRRLKNAPLDIPSYFSPHSANCVSQLLERNPRRRLGVTGIRTAMEHDFFRSINWRALYARRIEAPIRPCEGWKPPEAGTNETYPVATTPNSHAANSPTVTKMADDALDAATANFDNTFTRMPVETDDGNADANTDAEAAEELHENTFVGFTFDEQKPDATVVPQRERTHHHAPPQQQQQQQQQQPPSQQSIHQLD